MTRISLPRETVEAAIDRLISAEEMANNELGSEESANRFGRAAQALRAALQSAPPEQPQPGQWIACAERLPEPHKSVLVLFREGHLSCQAVAKYAGHGIWTDPGDLQPYRFGPPTHWMDLPPLPPPAQ